MKKILFIASEPAPGMIPFAVTIINTLSAVPNYDIYSICVNSGKYGYKGRVSEKAHPIFIERSKKSIQKIVERIWPYKVIAKIKQIRREVKPDVVHFLTGDFTLALYIRLFSDSSFYYTVHDLHPHEIYVQRIKDRIIHTMIVTGYKVCRDEIKHLTTSSKKQLDELKNIYEGRHIEYTCFPTLVNEDIIKGGKNVQELIGVDKYVLFFGNVDKYKGVDLLIEAFLKTDAKNGIKLVIAGRWSVAKNKTNRDVIFIDRFIDDRELRNLFENSLFVVYPYMSATMSGVLSLAFYFRKRMLLSDVPFFKQYATSETFFFKACDSDDLKKKLEMMLHLPKDVSEHDSYSHFYSDETLIDSYKALYNC